MRTEEFIAAIEDCGYSISSGEARFYIEDWEEGYLIATVCAKAVNRLNTDTEGFEFLEENEKSDLLRLLIHYAKTPLYERN